MQKKEILESEKTLGVLVDQPISSIRKTGNMLSLGFGESDANEKIIKESKDISKYALHVQSGFRFTLGDQVILARQDMFWPNAEIGYKEDFDWNDFNCDIKGTTRFEEQVADFFSPDVINDYVVKSIKVNKFGDITMKFTNDAVLEVSNDLSYDEEMWRFFEIGNIDTHFVVRGYGVEINENE